MKFIQAYTHDEEIPINIEYDINRNGETVKNVKEMVFGKVVVVEGKTEKRYREIKNKRFITRTYRRHIW